MYWEINSQAGISGLGWRSGCTIKGHLHISSRGGDNDLLIHAFPYVFRRYSFSISAFVSIPNTMCIYARWTPIKIFGVSLRIMKAASRGSPRRYSPRTVWVWSNFGRRNLPRSWIGGSHSSWAEGTFTGVET